MKILVAIDGSAHSGAAVDEIARQQLSIDSEVRVLSVVSPYVPATYSPWGGMDVSRYDEMEAEAREQAQAAVDKAAAKLRANDPARRYIVTTKVLVGSPKSVILEEADAFDADLIVVGSHGHGMVDRFLLGSVSQAVALHARRSVEIVRRPNVQTSERRPTETASPRRSKTQ